MQNENKIVSLTKIQQYQVKVVKEVEQTLKQSNCEVSPYGQKCMVNAVAGVVAYLKANGKSFEDINLDLFKISIQNIGITELNYASLPAEIYIDVRGDVLTLKPQGAGNEKLVRKYGVNVAELALPWLIREGDEFTLPSYDGDKCTPPKWVRKSLDKKVVAVCYMITKKNGEKEWLISGREEVATNLIAHIRNNALYKFYKTDEKGKKIYDKYNKPIIDEEKRQEFYDSLEGRTLDDLLSDKSLRDYINPTYISGGSKEQMIIRKMKNNALKNYPREYDNSFIKDAVVNMFEDVDESLDVKQEEVIDVDANAPKDFEVDENGEVKVEKKVEKEVVKEQPKVEEGKHEELPPEEIKVEHSEPQQAEQPVETSDESTAEEEEKFEIFEQEEEQKDEDDYGF